MTTELRSYVRLITESELADMLADSVLVDSESTGVSVDLMPIRKAAEKASGSKGGQWDSRVLESVHRALKVPRRLAADMRFWHWMTVAEFPDLVWRRWHGQVPESVATALASKNGNKGSSLAGRFLGNPTLHGVSRNTLARLWWCGESLYSAEDGYKLAEMAVAKQDLFQAVFERKFGLYPPAAIACVRILRKKDEETWRKATKRLNHHLTTIVLEALGETEIAKLLKE